MRRLILLRHAEAAPPEDGDDLDRPLTEAGRAASSRVAAYLAGEHLFPDLVLLSPARRTRETWALAGAQLGDVQVQSEPRIYSGTAERLLALLQETGEAHSVMLVGHNPGIEDLLRLIVSHGDRYAYTRAMTGYPAGGIAVVDFPAEAWRDAAPRSGRLDRFISPASISPSND
jgi:phosphohistidine phosphatase